MTKNEKKTMIRIMKSLKEKYGEFNSIIFMGERLSSLELAYEKLQSAGIITEENIISPEVYVMKVINPLNQVLLYISKEPVEFRQERIFTTAEAKNTRDEKYQFEVDLGLKEVFESSIGLMIKEDGVVKILCEKMGHLGKRKI